MNSGYVYMSRILFFFEIPDNVKIISITITKLICGKMASKYSKDITNAFFVIYFKGYKCRNFMKLEQKRLLSSTYFTGNI